MNRNLFLICIIVGSLLLSLFVAPQFANKVIDITHLPAPKISARPFRLRLDLLGGTHLVYQADLSKVKTSAADSMSGVRDVVERRVNLFGVAEPVVQVSGNDRLIVELAGIKDVNQAIQLIGQTPFLEFRTELPRDQGDQIIKIKMGVQAGDLTAAVLCDPNNAQAFASFLVQYGADPCFQSAGLDGSHLETSQLVFDPQTYQAQVSLNLNDEGTKRFAEITQANVGRQVAIYLDGLPISTPVVQTAITDGNAVISGNFTPEAAKTLVERLNSGALPVPISLISQQTVGASLGNESLQKSLKAGLFGLIFVALFMILLYRLPGVVSILALMVYVLVVLSFYKIIPVTLTLAGIAGFILTLGMAVDANVLIFARMREELAAGKDVARAVDEGFKRAWLSIRDSHATTLISAVILYMFTTSIVKGFALTLGIGTIISLITATLITRTILAAFVRPVFTKRRWL